MAAALIVVTCLTAVLNSAVRAIEGSKSHSFQDDVVGRLGLGAIGAGTQKPLKPTERGTPKIRRANFAAIHRSYTRKVIRNAK